MKRKSSFKIPALIVGIIVSLFFALAYLPKLIGDFFEFGTGYLKEILQSYVYWSDPNAFFITYFIGYTLLWWKPLWGSIIIMAVSVFYIIIAGVDGPPIFAIPALITGLLYLLHWNSLRKA